jgi:hypothetical protein
MTDLEIEKEKQRLRVEARSRKLTQEEMKWIVSSLREGRVAACYQKPVKIPKAAKSPKEPKPKTMKKKTEVTIDMLTLPMFEEGGKESDPS